jgi:hypothetical protein
MADAHTGTSEGAEGKTYREGEQKGQGLALLGQGFSLSKAAKALEWVVPSRPPSALPLLRLKGSWKSITIV